jgi:predicted transcriptional regulator
MPVVISMRKRDNALHLQRMRLIHMKTANFPSLRVDPELRQAAQDVLREGETLSSFVEQSIRESIERRQAQGEFIHRGLISRDVARGTGFYVSSEVVIGRLEEMLARAKRSAKAHE